MRRWQGFYLAVCLVGGCTPTRVEPPAAPAAPAQWRNAMPEPADDQQVLREWWRGFADPLLDDLIAEALRANLDLRIAAARVREASAGLALANSILYPSLDFGVGGGEEKRIDRIIPLPGPTGVKLTTPAVDAVNVGLNFRWETDVFGVNRLTAEAYAAQLQASEAGRRALRAGLLAQVAGHYLELRGAQRRLTVLRQGIDLQRRRLRAMQAFYAAGLLNQADVARQAALLQVWESNQPGLERQIAALTQGLGVLLGKRSDYLPPLLDAAPAPGTGLPKLPSLFPATVLESRPDLQLARAEVEMAAANLGVAKGDWWPKFNLAASGGLGALALAGFPGIVEGVYTLGAGISAPLFNAGRISARITAADARLEQAALAYENAFLAALAETETAYAAHASAKNANQQIDAARNQAERAQRQREVLFRQGAANWLEVLEAEQNKLLLADEASKSLTALQLSLVGLYRAFGGGWPAEDG